jgi:FKBP-type peptidyl-prolyl cis-trans isomerase SlyD
MEQKNRFISATYELYAVVDGEKELVEQTSLASPFKFITGFGIAMDGFEQHLIGIESGTMFDFTLQPEEAFGEYDPAGVIKMEREAFVVDGKFDFEHIYPKAVITLVNSEQQYQMATVVEVGKDSVTLDTNHPYAGKTLNFIGMVRENREATDEEIQKLIRQLTAGCDGCGGGCGEEGCGSDGCKDGDKKGKGCCGGCGD